MALWPKPDNKKKQIFVRSAMAKLNEVGLVGIHDAGVTPGNLELYKTLARGDDFTVRVYASKDLVLHPPLPHSRKFSNPLSAPFPPSLSTSYA